MAIRTVVVGYGMAGKLFHCYLVNLVESIELYGVVSRNEETRLRIVEEQGCKGFETFQEAIGDPEVELIREDLSARLGDFFAHFCDPQYDLWSGGGTKAGKCMG